MAMADLASAAPTSGGEWDLRERLTNPDTALLVDVFAVLCLLEKVVVLDSRM